ncbi:MAG TPA: NAD(P)/FAD-dependent oxidoreductase [Vicinamibacterales bacterium]|nr:NAD(P)/FAD-dependent oxidoreductase [Vicinamibacterales bacterium]
MIVGAGAAGLATAIFARRAAPRLSVTVLDGARTIGAKILVSGGSRCNVTNRVVTDRDFWGGRPAIVRRVLRGFPVDATVAFFREIGVALHEEADGKLFPDSNRSRDVLAALVAETGRRGATIAPGCRVASIAADAGGFLLTTSRGTIRARAVVLATGGQSLPKTGSDGAGYAMARALGHTIVPTTPALAPLVLETDRLHRALSGVSQDIQLAVWIDDRVGIRLSGSLLWTHFGVSGPVALNASRHWLRARIDGRAVRVTVNFLPGSTLTEVDAEWTRRTAAHPRTTVLSLLARDVPASTARALLDRLAIAPEITAAHFPRADRRRLMQTLVEYPLPVVESRGYTYAEATAGGVALTEIDPASMASRVCGGLYLVGEILDVDGRIGGFNFQWAWSSGFVAGRALAKAHAPSASPVPARPR